MNEGASIIHVRFKPHRYLPTLSSVIDAHSHLSCTSEYTTSVKSAAVALLTPHLYALKTVPVSSNSELCIFRIFYSDSAVQLSFEKKKGVGGLASSEKKIKTSPEGPG